MKRLLCLSLFILSGCAPYNNKFDCPYGQGLGCASVSKVNRMVDRQEIDLDEDTPQAKHQVHVYYGPHRLSQMITIES